MAAGIDFQIDATQLNRLQAFCLAASNKLDRVTAVAMTRSAKTAQAKLRAVTPNYINAPTRYTLNSTFVKPAKEGRLSVIVGFKDYSSSGVPGAKYLQPQVAGGNRGRKGFENLLTRRGLLPPGQFAVPTGNDPLGLNAYGNIPAAKYVQVLSRLGSLREAGSQGNIARSPRSARKRRQADYFVATINGSRGIWARKADRAITPVFMFVNRINYNKKFPVKEIITKAFGAAFQIEFKRAVNEQLEYEARKFR